MKIEKSTSILINEKKEASILGFATYEVGNLDNMSKVRINNNITEVELLVSKEDLKMIKRMRSKNDKEVKDEKSVFIITKINKEDVDSNFLKMFGSIQEFCSISIFFKNEFKQNEFPNNYSIGNTRLFPYTKTLYILPNHVHKLTVKENMILVILMQYYSEVVSKDYLLKSIWNSADYFVSRSLDVYISRIRKILEKSDLTLSSIRGVGLTLIKNNE